ncbi:MAG: helix-turn-helix domain-containing protein [Tannerellaceae bacterium]|nr:helix-turn-helix domain-containing protein [Tannerellaceae bacterium]
MEEELYLASRDHRLTLLETYFIKALAENRLFNIQRLIPSIDLLKKETETTLSSMAEISCLSPKQYKRIFQEYIGVNPKEFIRIQRFQRALYLLHTQSYHQLQHVAFDCGYYDLSHMNKEFKIFSGYTPGEYLNHCKPYSDYFSID